MNQNTWKKLVGILLAIMLITAIFATNVFATTDETAGDGETGEETEKKVPEFADFSKATFQLTRNGTDISLEIKNSTMKVDTAGRDYYVFLTNGEEKAPIKFENTGYIDLSGLTNEDYKSINKTKVDVSTLATAKLRKAGDIYISIVEYNGTNPYSDNIATKNKYKLVVDRAKLERIKQEPLTKRITVFPSVEETLIYDYQNLYPENLKYTIKIGKITDQQILRDIRDGKSNCLNNLLTYAKSHEAIISKSGLTRKNAGLFSKGAFEHKAYYYGYFAVDTEGGKYYPVEDVMLFQAVNGTGSISDFLYNYLDANFVWDLEEAPETPATPSGNLIIPDGKTNTLNNTNKPTGISGNMDNTKASGTIPQTGSIPMVTIGILSVIVLVGGFAYYQNKKYKGI